MSFPSATFSISLFLSGIQVSLHQQSSGWQEASRVRFVRSTPPPQLTAFSCLETWVAPEKSCGKWAGFWSRPWRLTLLPFIQRAARAQHTTSCSLLTAACRLFHPYITPCHYCQKSPSAEMRWLDWRGFLLLAMQKRANLNFKTWGSAMIKLSDRLWMFWCHHRSAIRCFVQLIGVHNLLYSLQAATMQGWTARAAIVDFQAKNKNKKDNKRKTEFTVKITSDLGCNGRCVCVHVCGRKYKLSLCFCC